MEQFRFHAEFAEARDEPAELDDGRDAFEDAHVREADFLSAPDQGCRVGSIAGM